MSASKYLSLVILFLFVRQQHAMSKDLPWTIRKLFDQNLNEFYATITDSQERTLMHAFKNSHGNPDRASEIIKQLDPKLYSYYSQVFPAYYTKLNALTHETHHFYKDIVLDKIKSLIKEGAYQRDFFKQFAVIRSEWERLSENAKAEFTRNFYSVSEYLDSPAFIKRANVGADYD